MLKGLKDLNIKLGSGAGPTIPTNPLKDRKYTVDKSGHVQFQNKGGNVGKGMGGPGDKPYIVNPDGTITWLKPKGKAAGGKISKYYAGGGNVITGRD